jgi:MFS family permease
MNENPPLSKTRTLIFTSLAHFMNDGMVFFVPVIGDLLAKDHAISAVMITAMLTVFYVASAGFGMVVAPLADALGRRGALIALGIFILSLGLAGFYLSLVLAAGAGSDVVIVIAALIAGIGSSFYHPLGGSVLQLTFSPESRGTALGVNGAFGSLGRALYPSLFSLVALLAISHASTIIIFAALGILSAAVIASGLKTAGRASTKADAALPAGSAEAVPDPPKDAVSAVASTDHADTKHTIKSTLNGSVLALMAIAFFRSVGFTGVVSWIPIYLTTQKHLGVSSQLGYTVTIMYAGGIVGQPLFGLLADRFDKRFVLALNSLGSAAGLLAYVSFTGAAGIVSLVLFGFFTFSGFPLLLSLVSDYVPRGASSTGNALVWGLGSTAGQAVGPLVVGLLIVGSYARLSSAFEIMAAVVAATVLGTPLLAKKAPRTKMSLF